MTYYCWSGVFKVILIATVFLQTSTVQCSKDPHTSEANSNATGKVQSTHFLAHFGMNQMENSKHKRNIKSDDLPKSQHYSTRNHRCPCNQELRQQPIPRSPNCVRRFLVKQLQETNENINCLLGCLARNSAKCKCPLPSRMNLNLNGEQDTYGFETDHPQSEGGQSSDTDVSNNSMYPCSCGICMYEPNLPSDETTGKINKRMVVDEPLVYYRIHSAPNGDELDWKHFSDIKRFLADTDEEIDVEQDDHIAEASRRRKSKKALTDSRALAMSLSRLKSSETQNKGS